ncbi:MAG: hypothetical protein V1846_01765 [Candidatus Komeilibacteria bacterium]
MRGHWSYIFIMLMLAAGVSGLGLAYTQAFPSFWNGVSALLGLVTLVIGIGGVINKVGNAGYENG